MNETVAQYLTQHADRFVEELKEFLRIPTVSADPAFKPHILRGAEFVHRQFSKLGFRAETVPTAGHPIVYAEWLKAPGAPTVLVYGHYDVQPADPLDLWTTPPFEPLCETVACSLVVPPTTRGRCSRTSSRRKPG